MGTLAGRFKWSAAWIVWEIMTHEEARKLGGKVTKLASCRRPWWLNFRSLIKRHVTWSGSSINHTCDTDTCLRWCQSVPGSRIKPLIRSIINYLKYDFPLFVFAFRRVFMALRKWTCGLEHSEAGKKIIWAIKSLWMLFASSWSMNSVL